MADEKNKDQDKKIIIDEDWKAEAQREKEKLAAELEAGEGAGSHGRRESLPEGNFAALVSMLVTQTMFALGALKMEGQEPQEPDLELARYHIDMLGTLEQKTRGNLSPQESKVLTQTLNDLRMAFVQLTGQ